MELDDFLVELEEIPHVRTIKKKDGKVAVKFAKYGSLPKKKVTILFEIPLEREDEGDEYFYSLEYVTNVVEEDIDADYILDSAVQDALQDPELSGAAEDFLQGLLVVSAEDVLDAIREGKLP